MKIILRQLLLLSALSAASVPLFASAVQEKELEDLLSLKRGSSQTSSEESSGVTQTVDGQFMEFSKGELTIRVPLDYGLANAQRIIELLNGGLSAEQVAGKWMVSEDSEFVSIEFDGPTFIMVKSNAFSGEVQPDLLVYTGTYWFENNDIILNEITQGDNFGVIRITDLTIEGGMTFSFSQKADASEEYLETFITTQKAPVFESDQTDMLCRLWRLVRRDGLDTQNTEYDETIRFTKSGTYLVYYPDQPKPELAQWRWKPNSAEQQFEFSWNPLWEEPGLVQIQQLTPSSFKLQQAKEQVVYEFVPAR